MKRYMPPFSLTTIDHVVIRSLSRPNLIAFYINVIGCELVWDRPEIGLTHLRAGDTMIDIVSINHDIGERATSQDDRSGKNVDHLCLCISPFDFEALRTHLVAFGINVAPPKMRFGARGFAPSIYLTDPEGNGIELKSHISS